ncbi:MAG: PIN domain-containing protein [Thermoplasmataceae archaeon]
MDYIPDTSVIVDGRFYDFIKTKTDSRIIFTEAMLSEVEHQANEGKSIGFVALEELKKIRIMADHGTISLEITGKRPGEWQIEKARVGEIDDLIRNVAAEYDAILVTGDNVQREIAVIKGIRVEFLEPKESLNRNIEEFFDDMTISAHIKVGSKTRLKKGYPGHITMEIIGKETTEDEAEAIANNVIKRARRDHDSFIEMDNLGATVVQLRQFRIVIARQPFASSLEITAVRPIKTTTIEDYNLDQEILDQILSGSYGILVAGSPGAGKSTFVQALANHLNQMNLIVKTMERPRDLQVSKDITQYTALDGSMEKTGDLLLLVRNDYTIFDEMRVTSDFKVFGDLRLAGVGMIGVVHATRAIDAIHRFIGRIELGLIPQVIDTVLYISKGDVASILKVHYVVKVPSGMMQDDLARPVIVISEHPSNEPKFEIYTFGDQVVVVPVNDEPDSSVFDSTKTRIIEEIGNFLGTSEVEVKMKGSGKAVGSVPEPMMARLIGRKGASISELEKKLKVRIDVEALGPRTEEKHDVSALLKNKIIYLDTGRKSTSVNFYIDDMVVLQAISSNKGIVRVKVDGGTGSTINRAMKAGKIIKCSFP